MATSTSTTGWPDATNTGVPAGVTLTPSGDVVVTQAGAVISGLNISGTVYIDAPNVTLVDCKITAASFSVVQIAQGITGTVVQNCEINGVGSGNDGSCGINGQGTFIGNNIYNVENGINVTGSSTIQDNYIHNLLASGSPHYDGIQIDGGVSNITISHNTVINSHDQASAIMIDNYWGAASNISVNNNLLDGGGYTVYDDAHFNSSAITGVSFTNNHMGTGYWGYTDFNGTNPTYTGNVNDGATLISTLNTPTNDTTSTSTTTTSSTAPAAPVISSFSHDSGTVGDHITNDNTPTLTGTAAANSTVKVFDGATQLGTATANSSGQWTLTTPALSDGSHSLTATDTDSSGLTSASSKAFSITIDTQAPTAPVVTADTVTNTNHIQLSGTAEANSAITIYDGTTVVGTGVTNSSGSWSVTTSSLSTGVHALTATATDAAGNVSGASGAVDPTIGATTAAAPTIASWSPDSGVVGDGVTDHNVLTLKGAATANSTVNVYDGSTHLGTATADSTGAWSYTTSALKDGAHTLTATDTVSGVTSAASAAVSVTVDTVAPTAPVVTADSVVNTNHVQMSGTAEANSTINVYDGNTLVGTGGTNSSGSWSVTTSALSNGSHALTATATDVAGNVSGLSGAVDQTVGTTTTTTTTTATVSAPTIASWSPDSGVVGDGITDHNVLTLKGAAAANSTVNVFDGSTHLGTATADSTGAWSYTTSALNDGSHTLTATDTVSGATSAASAAVSVTVDTVAPAAPVVTGESVVNTDHVQMSGTAEANSSISVFDGTTVVGTGVTNSSGSWSVTTSALSDGAHALAATATDAAGNVSGMSTAVDPVIGATTTSSGSVEFTNLYESRHHHVATISGTADANSHVSVLDGNNPIGTTTADSSGNWTFKTGTLSDTVHTFTAQELDGSGHVVATSSGEAILGTHGHDVLTSTSGNDYFVGGGHPDTFVFAPNFGHDVIKDFSTCGWHHDTIQFSSSEFSNFASVLSHASQVGQDVVITSGSDTLTLKNTKLSSLHAHDFHFA